MSIFKLEALPVMGLWLLSPGTQVSRTVRSYGSDSTKLVGGFGRSKNKQSEKKLNY